jgi:tetratricopeptide (TPR) repeat protein
VAADSPRILELQRRVLADPSSIAFAQLGEELRRMGANEDAIGICRTGLERHPAYLSARVTLGRALLELDRLDEAHTELLIVVSNAPDNLAAIRGLAEIHQRRGELGEALVYYRRALELARHDPDRCSISIVWWNSLAPNRRRRFKRSTRSPPHSTGRGRSLYRTRCPRTMTHWGRSSKVSGSVRRSRPPRCHPPLVPPPTPKC